MEEETTYKRLSCRRVTPVEPPPVYTAFRLRKSNLYQARRFMEDYSGGLDEVTISKRKDLPPGIWILAAEYSEFFPVGCWVLMKHSDLKSSQMLTDEEFNRLYRLVE